MNQLETLALFKVIEILAENEDLKSIMEIIDSGLETTKNPMFKALQVLGKKGDIDAIAEVAEEVLSGDDIF